MRPDKPTNPGGHARLLLKHLFMNVRETRRRVPVAEYRELQIGLSPAQLLAALRQLIHDGSIGMDAEGIYLTSKGVQTGDYLWTRQPEILLNDPLPELLSDIQTEMRHLAQERSRIHPKAPEWEWINGRIDDLRHLENTMTPVFATARRLAWQRNEREWIERASFAQESWCSSFGLIGSSDARADTGSDKRITTWPAH